MHWMYFHGFHLFYPSRPILFRQSHWTTHHSRYASRSNCNPIQFNFRTLKRDIVLADNYVRLAWSIAIGIWWSIPLKGVDKLSPWSIGTQNRAMIDLWRRNPRCFISNNCISIHFRYHVRLSRGYEEAQDVAKETQGVCPGKWMACNIPLAAASCK